MTLNIDLAPTFLALAGVDAPASTQGRDLSPLLRGERVPWRKEWFYSHLFQNAGIPKSEGIRTERWAYIRWIERDPVYEELFDLSDPLRDVHNLAGAPQHREQLIALRERWKAWRTALDGWRADRRWRDPG
jgi:arylsulfatase A-like enzyme